MSEEIDKIEGICQDCIHLNEIMPIIEQLQQENRELKKKLYSPDVIDTTCPKCGEKFTTNYSRAVYDLKYILTEFEKWIESKLTSTYSNNDMAKGYKNALSISLDKLQELKEGRK